METIMIQNNTEEYGYIRNIEASPQKKNIPKQSQKRKPPSRCRLCGDLHIARNGLLVMISAMYVEKA